jgi:hypothetical protein
LIGANRNRIEMAALKEDARRGRVDVRDLLLSPPDCLKSQPVIDVMLFARRMRPTASKATRARIGRLALHHQINVLVAVGDASERTRLWAANNAMRPHTAALVAA